MSRLGRKRPQPKPDSVAAVAATTHRLATPNGDVQLDFTPPRSVAVSEYDYAALNVLSDYALSRVELNSLESAAITDRAALVAAGTPPEPKYGLLQVGQGWCASSGDWSDSRAARQLWASWSPERQQQVARRLPTPVLARTAGVYLVAVTGDGQTLVTRRTAGDPSFPDCWTASIGETAVAADVVDGHLDPFRIANRGAFEEFGLRPVELELTAVVASAVLPQCGWLAVATFDVSAAELANHVGGHAATEFSDVAVFPATPAAFAEFAARVGSSWVPCGFAAVRLACTS